MPGRLIMIGAALTATPASANDSVSDRGAGGPMLSRSDAACLGRGIAHPFACQTGSGPQTRGRRVTARRLRWGRAAGLMDIAIYAAVAENGVIGRDGGLPWRLSSDIKRFKAGTMGKPIIMGRKTWESFPRRPLPGRLNIVISRDPAYRAEGAEAVTSLGDALTLAEVRGALHGGRRRDLHHRRRRDLSPGNRRCRPAAHHACAGKLRRRHAISADRPGNLEDGQPPRIFRPARRIATRHATWSTNGEGIVRSTPDRAHSATGHHQMLFVAANRAGCSGGRVESVLAHPYKGSTCEFRLFRRRPEAQAKGISCPGTIRAAAAARGAAAATMAGRGARVRGPSGPQGSPPDLEDIIRRGQDRLRRALPGGGSASPALVGLIGLALAGVLAVPGDLYRAARRSRGRTAVRQAEG